MRLKKINVPFTVILYGTLSSDKNTKIEGHWYIERKHALSPMGIQTIHLVRSGESTTFKVLRWLRSAQIGKNTVSISIERVIEN